MPRLCRLVPFSVVAVLLCLPALAVAQKHEEWKSYSFPGDGFGVSFPAEPEVNTRTVEAKGGSFELRSYGTQVGETALYVAVSERGAKAAEAEKLLAGAMQGALDQTHAVLVSQSKTNLGAAPGLAFEADAGATRLSFRFYLSDGVLYQLLVAAPLVKPFDGADRFFGSFQLLARAGH